MSNDLLYQDELELKEGTVIQCHVCDEIILCKFLFQYMINMTFLCPIGYIFHEDPQKWPNLGVEETSR